MRARALHPDVLALTSAVLHVNAVIVRGASHEGDPDAPLPVVEVPAGAAAPGESFLVDSPVLPEELELLPSVLAQARFPPIAGVLATHADWDHLLGRLAFAGAALGCAETSVARLAAEPGAAQRALREFDEGLYIERPQPLALGAPQALPVPGRCELGARELELLATAGHTADGMAVRVPWAGVLIAGDYLSEIEIPMLGTGGSVEAYVETLARLRPVALACEHVVPGHGPLLTGPRAAEIAQEDDAYLRALQELGADAELPPGRRSPEQRRVHAANVAALSSRS